MTQMENSSGCYLARLELAEALAVNARLQALRDIEGESPALSRALAAQTAVVELLRPPLPTGTAENQCRTTPQLQLSKNTRHAGEGEIRGRPGANATMVCQP